MSMFRFTGEYTGNRMSLVQWGVTFDGHESAEVPDGAVSDFEGHPEFEAVHPLDHDGDGKKGGSKRRHPEPAE